MDTSKEYIKMCDCSTIQEQAKYEDFNYFICMQTKKIRHSHPDDYGYMKNMNFLQKEREYIWLPRQDQIQEMLRKYYAQKIKSKRSHDKWFPEGAVGLSYVLRGFCTHIKKNQLLLEKYKSFEQLWLAFYMWEIDESVWIKDKWVN